MITGSLVSFVTSLGRLVKLAPLIAGKAPLNFELLTVDNRASATVPVKFPAGMRLN